MRVVRNACLDRLRARKRFVEIQEEDYYGEARLEPSGVLSRQQMQTRLMSIIHELEEPWRSLLVLRDIHQHSYESVGEILELKAAQVKVYLYRVRQKLAECWQEQNVDQ